ncbi:MAG: 2-oxoacid:ferredoxin oxidoreductase subunit beta [Candidatus Nealsonbacteria bacterium]|nr:2-oxoacid:ferredoxin oxidoreductase subunit beta [Candidatus Nealsonbacteria bacterium]
MNVYRTDEKPIWCPGCGLYGEIGSFVKALEELAIPNYLVSFVTGIGCSARAAGYANVYAVNGTHGESLPIAEGVKLANPELTVIDQGGDGDIWAIGAGHVPHAVRKNLDITLITCDNQVYALTKGQRSPTTAFFEDEEAAGGEPDQPLDPLHDMLAFMSTIKSGFVAQGISTKISHLAELIKKAIIYKGFSYVHVQTPCVTYNDPEWIKFKKEKAVYLEDGKEIILPNGEKIIYDSSDRRMALKITEVPLKERPYYGVIYQEKRRLIN